MQIKSIKLINFRSFKKAEFKFSPNTTLILGPNTVGKTNILEAIFLLSFGNSFRTSLDREMIRWKNEVATIAGLIEEGGDNIELELQIISKNLSNVRAKRFLVNGLPKRSIDFIGNLAVVLFAPNDLTLVIDSPSVRRKYLDNLLSLVDKNYRKVVGPYQKIITRRNKILERIRVKESKSQELEYWDEQLVKLGEFITRKRQKFFSFLENKQRNFSEFDWIYEPSIVTKVNLTKNREKEILSTTTLFGPHRDEFRFLKNGNDLSLFGSRGEQRMGVIALKYAETLFIEQELKTRPIFLLDDVFSEFDADNQKEVLKLVKNQQTLITATHKANFLPKNIEIIELNLDKKY
ncbi:MAG TPA: DNA replication/repair protein RecF [Patescibacteria group bacterium]